MLLHANDDSHSHGAERYDNWRQWHMVMILHFTSSFFSLLLPGGGDHAALGKGKKQKLHGYSFFSSYSNCWDIFIYFFFSLLSPVCARMQDSIAKDFQVFPYGKVLCRAMAHCVCRANRAQSDREEIDMMILWTITCWLGCCHFCAIFYNFIISVVVVFRFFCCRRWIEAQKNRLSVNSARIASGSWESSFRRLHATVSTGTRSSSAFIVSQTCRFMILTGFRIHEKSSSIDWVVKHFCLGPSLITEKNETAAE